MIVIATPTRREVEVGFTYDLINLVKETSDVVFSYSQGTLLSNLRTLLAKTSLERGASHILFIDSDMRFPSDALKTLLLHDVDIIGANCMQRTQNSTTARKNGNFITSKGKTGIEEVDTIGFGFTLIKTEVFKKLKAPWFATPWDGTKHVGEDIYFCTMAKEAGYKIIVDHDLSKEIKHIGNIEWQH